MVLIGVDNFFVELNVAYEVALWLRKSVQPGEEPVSSTAVEGRVGKVSLDCLGVKALACKEEARVRRGPLVLIEEPPEGRSAANAFDGIAGGTHGGELVDLVAKFAW